jgi:glycosyltransferase involved in cell wall biosynthesis
MSTSQSSASPKKLEVLFIGTATLPPLGADTRVHVHILSALDRSRHVVHAACRRKWAGSPTPTYEALRQVTDLRTTFVNLGPELFVRSFLGKVRGIIDTAPALPSLIRLHRYIRRNGIDVIHTSDRPRDAAAGVLLGRMTGAKCVVHCHNGYGMWMSRLLRWSMRQADARIAVSRFIASTFVRNGYPAASTYAVHNAIELSGWMPGQGREEARRELHLPGSAPVVITVCRLFPSKGPDELIRAVAIVHRTHPDVRLIVVGRELSDGSYSRQLTELARDLGIADNVIFTGQRSDVARLMAAADVFAMPSAEEPFGLVYVEAMAMKLPVVALNTGGTPEVVEHGACGLLSDPGDTLALARNLTALLDSDRLRRDMGEEGRRRVEERFTLGRMARETAEVYRLVASRQAGGFEDLQEAGHASRHGG